tara:strand:+ start:37017 stop:37427 length:411 start_codon:yes stop_codon:yes gene_type:complete
MDALFEKAPSQDSTTTVTFDPETGFPHQISSSTSTEKPSRTLGNHAGSGTGAPWPDERYPIRGGAWRGVSGINNGSEWGTPVMMHDASTKTEKEQNAIGRRGYGGVVYKGPNTEEKDEDNKSIDEDTAYKNADWRG